MSDCLPLHGLQHARFPCPSSTSEVYSNSCPLSRWCYATISSLVVPFSFCLQSFTASGSFLISQCFTTGGQIIGPSASTSVLPRNIQSVFIYVWLISMQLKGLSRVFSNTTVQKHQFFGAQLSLWTLQNLGILFIDSAFYDGCYFFENVNVLSILGHFSEFDVILFYTF